MTLNSENAHNPMTFRTNMSCDHHGFHDRSFGSNGSFNDKFTHEYQNNELHNHNIMLNGPGAIQHEQVRYVVSDASILTAVMAD